MTSSGQTSSIAPRSLCQLQNLSYEDLQERLTRLEPDMDAEIEELLKRYQAKRQPILDAIDAKKKRQQNF